MGISGEKVLLVLELERGDPAELVRISSGEMGQGALTRCGVDSLRRWVGSRQMSSKMRLIAQPACQPAVGGGDGKGIVARAPDAE